MSVKTEQLSPSSWCLVLPITKPISMNDRGHWRPRAEQTKQIRQATFLLAKHAKVDKDCTKIRVTLHYAPADTRRRDAINLAPTLKAAEDGLVDAKIIPDDTPVYLDPVMPVIDPPRKPAQLWLEVVRLA